MPFNLTVGRVRGTYALRDRIRTRATVNSSERAERPVTLEVDFLQAQIETVTLASVPN